MAEWTRIEDVFQRAVELETALRAAFLDGECAGDEDLRREVEALLAADSAEFPQPVSLTSLDAAVVAATSNLSPGMRLGNYVLVAPIASGGMGVVWRARRDGAEFEREVAIKLLKPAYDVGEIVARFRQERRTLARLAHPNIAQLYDAGATPSGLPYFVLELVDGQPIDRHCDERRLGVRERLELFAQVATAVHAAHQSFVVHRDLKPGNILVGRDGVPKLVDFGIAKLVDDDAQRSADLTRSGVRPMTPRYASPEQVRGEPITTASDVYSLGVVLYELLSGTPPYASDVDAQHAIESAILETRPDRPSTIVQRPRANATRANATRAEASKPSERVEVSPAVIASFRSTTPRDLARALAGDVDAIVLCALRKEPERRYASAELFADDVRKHLDGLPVRARPDSFGYRASKFAARHKVGVALSTLSLVALVASLAAYVRSSLLAAERLGEVLRLSDLARLDDFAREADALWPAIPTLVPKYEDWLRRAAEVERNLASHRAALERLRASARREGDQWIFADVATQWQHDKTSELIARLEAFADREKGLVVGVERRLAQARSLKKRSIDDFESEWTAARRSIADRAECPSYDGLELTPQMGLIPIGRDPDSKLWEFTHIASGEVARRGADGRLEIGDATGVVLVLVPGGTFWMGAQVPIEGREAQNADRLARDIEAPVHEVTLGPFFFGKYEVTQGQWLRLTGSNPSSIFPGQKHGEHLITLANPVESINVLEAQREIARAGLALPTEAQWEYAARAGTTTPWWTGADRESLRGAANLADAAAARAGAPWSDVKEWPDYDDGFVVHAKVDTLRANAFGLHHVLGNVWEFCADGFVNYKRPTREGDGWRVFDGQPTQAVGRGGTFVRGAGVARVSNRGPAIFTQKDETIGVRAARAIEK